MLSVVLFNSLQRGKIRHIANSLTVSLDEICQMSDIFLYRMPNVTTRGSEHRTRVRRDHKAPKAKKNSVTCSKSLHNVLLAVVLVAHLVWPWELESIREIRAREQWQTWLFIVKLDRRDATRDYSHSRVRR